MHLDVDLTAAVITFLTAFLVSAVSGRFLIPFLRQLKAGQTERGDGPKSHLKKTGTPNMGGLMILLGLTIGCLLSNILTGCALPDVIFGTLATFIGAVGSYMLRKNRWLCSLPPILSNAIIIPFVLRYAYHIPGSIPFFMLTVGAGEVISCFIFGQILISVLNPIRDTIFNADELNKK